MYKFHVKSAIGHYESQWLFYFYSILFTCIFITMVLIFEFQKLHLHWLSNLGNNHIENWLHCWHNAVIYNDDERGDSQLSLMQISSGQWPLPIIKDNTPYIFFFKVGTHYATCLSDLSPQLVASVCIDSEKSQPLQACFPAPLETDVSLRVIIGEKSNLLIFNFSFVAETSRSYSTHVASAYSEVLNKRTEHNNRT